MHRSSRILAGLVIGLVAYAASACGTPADNAPDESTITFQPTSVTLTPLGTEDCTFRFIEEPAFNAVLRNGDGQPLNDTAVTFKLTNVLLDFVVNGSVVLDREITRVTDSNGVIKNIQLSVAFCQFTSQLSAISGTAFSQATIAVNAAVPNQPPTAVAAVIPTTGTAGVTAFNFSSTGSTDSDGSIVSFLWDFGDGTPTSAVANPTHTYAVANPSYTVTLTVTDDDGATATDTVTVTVNP
jgi:PKD repeat protein